MVNSAPGGSNRGRWCGRAGGGTLGQLGLVLVEGPVLAGPQVERESGGLAALDGERDDGVGVRDGLGEGSNHRVRHGCVLETEEPA